MGCIGSKDASTIERPSRRGSVDRRVAHVNSARREDGVRPRDGGEAKVGLIDRKVNGSSRLNDDRVERNKLGSQVERSRMQNFDAVSISLPNIDRRKIEKLDVLVVSHPSQGSVPNCLEAEQVAAGWPSWLASAAGEAIRGWIPRRANNFEKLDRIGQGTYSNVYKARDVAQDKLVALKKVRFDNKDIESVKFMAREILILRRLDHPNIIKLEGLITSQNSSSLYLVFEYMEHDLTGLSSLPGMKFTEPQIKCYMQQLLSGLEHCHSRSVLHRDIKGSNLLIDDNGILKIADFGLATFYDPRSSVQLTSRVVTLWYRAPELLLGASKYGVAVDLWSAGCILGELYTGKPVLPGRTEVEQLHKIFKLCGSPSEDYWRTAKLPHSSVMKPQRPYRRCVTETFKDCPASAVGLLEMLLSIDPVHRGTTATALQSEYFTTKPYACDPSCLPKYPPSKEMDAKMRDEESRRQGQQGTGVSRRNGAKESIVSHESNTNPDMTALVQRGRTSNAGTRGEMFTLRRDYAASSLLIDPSVDPRGVREGKRDSSEQSCRNVSHSGPLLVQGAGWSKAVKGPSDLPNASRRTNLSTLSGLVATRTTLPDDSLETRTVSQPEVAKQVGRSHAMLNGLRPATRMDQSQKMPDSPSGESKHVAREPTLHGRGPRGKKIYMSGPLLGPSNNTDQMLKEHDRHIQEFARRRLDKSNNEKMRAR